MNGPDKYFNILSIDGGGIKGLYAARVLEQIEQKFSAKIVDHFDLICGTSTGGLIALALSLNHKAKEIANFYTARGKYIFPPKSWFGRIMSTLKQGIISNKYKSESLRKELTNFFGHSTQINDCHSLLCIPAYNISQGMPIVFKYPHKEGNLFRDGDINVVDVALATSSAPTYFKNHLIDESTLQNTFFTDGGVWANNPALCGLIEAWTYFVGPSKEFDAIRILSISTIPKPSGVEFDGGSFLKWNKRLIGTALEGQSYFTNYFLSQTNVISHLPIEYLRVVPTNISSDQQKKLNMDLASTSSIKLLNQLGTSSGIEVSTQNYDWLAPIFSERKKYII